MGQNRKQQGQQKGAVEKNEGQRGRKTHGKFLEELQSGPSGEERQRSGVAGDPSHAEAGKHRMFEGREQHDEAELNSEKTRLSRDIDRHDHDREQFDTVVGGTENHPKLPSSSGPGNR